LIFNQAVNYFWFSDVGNCAHSMSGENTARDYSDELNAGQPSPATFHVPRAADNYNPSQRADNYLQENGENNNHADRLDDARKNDGGSNMKEKLDEAKKIAELATPMGAVSLLGQINILSDMPYIAAIGAAILKDLLDFVAGPILFSILCSIFIFMMMVLVGSTGKKKGANKFIKKVLLLIGGGVADSIPGIDFFPIETATVAAIYFLTLVERKNAQ